MLAIVDYGVGNLFSLRSSFEAIGEPVQVTDDPIALANADGIILPGVGAFGDAAEKLRRTGLSETVAREAKAGKPLLGICLGMQLLFEKSLEYGEHQGLGLLRGTVRPIREVIPTDYKIPHIGWNALEITRQVPLLCNTKNGEFVYFVHSYYAADCADSLAATADYGAKLTAMVQKENICGCQFHPEKSGEVGLRILRAFASMAHGKEKV